MRMAIISTIRGIKFVRAGSKILDYENTTGYLSSQCSDISS